MNKSGGYSDSEDEAFQSADEGDEQGDDGRPSPKSSSQPLGNVSENAGEKENQEISISGICKTENDAISVDEDNVVKNLPLSEQEEQKLSAEATHDVQKVQNEEMQNPVISISSNESNEVVKKKIDSEFVEILENTQKDGSKPTEIKAEEDKATYVAKDDEDTNTVHEVDESSKEKQDSKSCEVLNSPIAQAMDRLTMTVDETKDSTNETSQRSSSSQSSSSATGWGWGGWGDMLSKATSSVSSMIETVETQIGIPNPMEMARNVMHGDTEHEKNQDKKEKDEQSEADTADMISKQPNVSQGEQVDESEKAKSDADSDNTSGLTSWLSGLGVSKISTLVQNTGKEFVSGSLDALEFVGKKTMDVISKGDPGFRRRRTTLSQVIREAKQRAENKGKDQDVQSEEEYITFSLEFDRFQGLAHLEALEMISHESEAEIEKMLLTCSEEAKKDNDNLFSLLEKKFEESLDVDEESEQIPAIEQLEEIIKDQVANLSLNIDAAKLLAFSSSSNSVNLKDEKASVTDLYSKAITDFADLTARSVEFFHKVGELMLLPDVKASFLVKSRSDGLRIICDTLKQYVTALSGQYATMLNDLNEENDDENRISKYITDVYLEASNSSTYINDSYRLLLPIFQFTAVR